LTVNDTANAAVPSGNALATTSLLVNPQITLAQSLGTAWPDAVHGRAYGTGTGCSGGNCAPAKYTASGGLGTLASAYNWTALGAGGNNLGTLGFSTCNVTTATNDNDTDSCFASTITAGSGTPGATPPQTDSPTMTVIDTANAATPAATATSAGCAYNVVTCTDPNSIRTDTLVVDSPLLATLAQTTNLSLPGTLLPGVVGRSYGVGNNCSNSPANCATPTYTSAGGLGAATVGVGAYEWCITASGALPTGFLNTGGNVNTACASPNVENTATLGATTVTDSGISCTNGVCTPPSDTFSYTMELDDKGNGSTPSSIPSASNTPSTVGPTNLVINAPLTASMMQSGNPTTLATLMVGPGTPASPTVLLPGVTNRSYGQVATTLASAAPPIFSAVGGLESASGKYLWCVNSGSLPPNEAASASAFPEISAVCGSLTSTQSYTVQLSTVGSNPVGTAGTYSFSVQADDGGNPAVPSTFAAGGATDSIIGNLSLTINPQISLALAIGSNNYSAGASGTWPDAVNGRPYGSPAAGPAVTGCTGGGNCAAAVYTASEGLGAVGGYSWTALGSAGDNLNSFGSTTCAESMVTDTNDTNTCNAATITAGNSAAGAASVTFGSGTGGPTMTVTDMANAATPAATATSCPGPTTAGATCTDPESTRTDQLTVDAPLLSTLSQTGNASLPTLYLAVTGRDYGDGSNNCSGGAITPCTPPSYAATGGLGANPTGNGGLGPAAYEWCVQSGAGIGLPPASLTASGTAFTASCPTYFDAGVTPLVLTGLPITDPATTYPFNVELDDTGNTATPSSSSVAGASSTSPTSLTVEPALAVTVVSPTGILSLPPAVVNRDYGNPTGTDNCGAFGLCSPLTYMASGGLQAAGAYASLMPSGIAATPGVALGAYFPDGFSCMDNGTNTSLTCTAHPVIAGDTTGTYTPSVIATDTANPATPSGIASPPGIFQSLTVNPQITLAQTLTATWPDAVHGRAYGTGTGCTGAGTNCAPAKYTASGGLGTLASAYNWTALGAGGNNLGTLGFSTCNVTTATNDNDTDSCFASTITAGSSTPGATPPQTDSPTMTVTDTANPTTPAATATSAGCAQNATTCTDPNSIRTDTLVVDSPLLATLAQTTNLSLPGTLLPGVQSRSYGTGNSCSNSPANCAAPTYTSAGGLGAATVGVGAYQWCISAGALPTGFLNTGGNVNTACASPNVENTATLGATDVSSVITPPSQTFTYTMELDDAGNSSTPSSFPTTSNTPGTVGPTNLLINAPLQVVLTENGNTISNSTGTTGSLLPGVQNRTYGTGNNCVSAGPSTTCTPPTYTASYGLGAVGGYTFPASPGPFTTLPSVSGGFTCSTTTTNPYTCSSPQVSSTAATYNNLSLTVNDTANAAVPSGNALATTSLLVNPQITIAQTLTATWPEAVHGRAYGTGGGCSGGNCAPAQYTASGGLGTLASAYNWTALGAGGNNLGTLGFTTCNVTTSTNSSDTDSCFASATLGITAAPSTPGAASQSYSPTMTVTDTPNAATPAATATSAGCAYNVGTCSDPGSIQTDTLVVDSPLLATLTQTGNPHTSGSTLTELFRGVAGRDYGNTSVNECGAGLNTQPCIPPSYAATGGLGEGVAGATAYEWCVPTASAFPPTGFGINGATISTNCPSYLTTGNSLVLQGRPIASSANTNTNGNPITYAYTVELDDTGNTSTPGATSTSYSSTAATNLYVHPALAVNVGSSDPSHVTLTSLPDAVVGRDYGNTNDTCAIINITGKCVSVVYTASGGLTASSAYSSITPNGTGLTSAGAGFPYGITCNGNTPLTALTCSGTIPATGGNAVTPANNTTTYPGDYTPSVTAQDTANNAVPYGTAQPLPAATWQVLNVDPQITFNTGSGCGSTANAVCIGGTAYTGNWPNGINNRPYGNLPTTTITGCNPTATCAGVVYAATGGLSGGYTYDTTVVTAISGFACSPDVAAPNSTISTCAATSSPNYLNPGAGTYSPSVTATDNANHTTPAATADPGMTLTSTNDLTVDPALAINNAAQLPNGELNQPYSVVFDCETTVGSGHCSGASSITWTGNTANNITGVDFHSNPSTITDPITVSAPGSATFSGTPSATGSETVAISIADAGNVTTPSCTALSSCPVATTFTANIEPSYAIVGDNSATGDFDLFDTSSGAPLLSGFEATGLAGSTPNYPAASTNGSEVFVADPGLGKLNIYTFSPAVLNTYTVTGALGDAAAVAVGPQAVPTAGISPDAVYAYVADTHTDDVEIVDGNPADSGTSFGMVVQKITLPTTYGSNGPSDIKIAPTFNVSGTRVTHGYVLRPGSTEVCVIDAEPSSTHFALITGATIAAYYGGGVNPNTDSCISLVKTALPAKFIDISPNGLHAFVTEGDNATSGYVEVIDTNPNSPTFETNIDQINLTPAPVTIGTGDGGTTGFSGSFTPAPVPPGSLQVTAGAVTGTDIGGGIISGAGVSGTVNYATGLVSVTFTVAPAATVPVVVSDTFNTVNPQGVRFSPDGQYAWVAGKESGVLLGIETALVGSQQFAIPAGTFTPTPASDHPVGIAFRPDFAFGASSGGFGLATLSGGPDLFLTPGYNFVGPWNATTTYALGNEVFYTDGNYYVALASSMGVPPPTSLGTDWQLVGGEIATTPVTTPWGIDHNPNAVLHLVTNTLPAATHGVAYASSIVAGGVNKYFTFTDLTAAGSNLAHYGFTLQSDGQVTATSVANSTGTHSFTIQVTDQSKPVPNVVVGTVTLQIQ
jgi:hypothetical protein